MPNPPRLFMRISRSASTNEKLGIGFWQRRFMRVLTCEEQEFLDAGNVNASGLNDCGQLGVSDGRAYTIDPVEVSGLPDNIVKISAGYYHSSAITESGQLYMWGKNSSGQLGFGKKAGKVIPVPSKVEILNGDEAGEVLSWGGGESGRLGHGYKSSLLGFLTSTSEYTPRLIKELERVKIKSIAAGMLHSVCIDENGFVYVFGEKAVQKFVSARSRSYVVEFDFKQIN